MKDFAGTVIATAKNQLEQNNPFIWLIEIRVPTEPTPTRFRLTNYNEAVSRGTSPGGNPLVYSPFPVAHGDFKDNGRGDLPSTTINVANVTLEMIEELEAYDGLRGEEVVIRLVNIQSLLDPNAERSYRAKIIHTSVDQNVISLTTGNSNLQKALFPRNRCLAHHCRWVKVQGGFGGSLCGYVIPAGATNVVGFGFDHCAGTMDDCRERGEDELARLGAQAVKHPGRFGGFPGTRRGSRAT